MSARVTMRDVARAVGMSPMTVSRALREDKTVNAETRAKIRATAQDLGYVYDTTAQAFRTQKSGFIAVTLPSINNANFAQTFHALSEGLEGSGTQLLLGSTNYRLDQEEKLVGQLLSRNPEALILTGGAHTAATRQLVRDRGLPVVEMWDLPQDPLGHVVGFSNADAMADLVRHLAQTGRRKLAFVGATAGTDMRGAGRKQGVIDTARALGLPEVAVFDAGPAPVSMQHGAQIVADLGQQLNRYDALICVSDPVAIGCLSACQRLGVNVPDDLAITGFGASEVAEFASARITTVNLHAQKIGEQVVKVLQDIIGAEAELERRIIDLGAQLVLGETT